MKNHKSQLHGAFRKSDVLSSILGLPGRSSSWAPPLAHVPGLITHGQLICLITWPLFKMVIQRFLPLDHWVTCLSAAPANLFILCESLACFWPRSPVFRVLWTCSVFLSLDYLRVAEWRDVREARAWVTEEERCVCVGTFSLPPHGSLKAPGPAHCLYCTWCFCKWTVDFHFEINLVCAWVCLDLWHHQEIVNICTKW